MKKCIMTGSNCSDPECAQECKSQTLFHSNFASKLATSANAGTALIRLPKSEVKNLLLIAGKALEQTFPVIYKALVESVK